MAVFIDCIKENSPAHKAGIVAGEQLISINGNEILDVLDYRFYQINNSLTLEILSNDNQKRTVNIKKSEYEEIGFEFSTYLIDKQRSCRNNCIFCFIDQLPKGLRKSLYFKDDDSRLSFLFGNYITLTNITEHEVSRIIKMHISPINISVHTTNPDLRVKMMKNRFAGDSLSVIKRFTDVGIVVNCQIVACRDINDGDELVRSLTDLDSMGVNMVAVVPVGLTNYREGLHELKPYDKQSAAATLDIVERFGNESKKRTGARKFFAADEFYIKAGRDIPNAEFYEDFPALENGVGLISCLRDDIIYELEPLKPNDSINRTVSIACGTSVAPYLRLMIEDIVAKFPNVSVNVYPIINKFFGEQINVSGLVVGGDIVNQLNDKPLGDALLITSNMLNYDNTVFLDDTTPDYVSQALNIPLVPVNNNGQDFISAILGVDFADLETLF